MSQPETPVDDSIVAILRDVATFANYHTAYGSQPASKKDVADAAILVHEVLAATTRLFRSLQPPGHGCRRSETEMELVHEPVYSAEHDNYYCKHCKCGMGNDYYLVAQKLEKAEQKLRELLD